MSAFLAAHLSYGVLFVWSLLEGEIGLILGGYLSRVGTLDLYTVVLIAFSGAVISDTLLYLIGRYYRLKALKRVLRDIRKAYGVKRWFLRYGGWVVVFDRFIYGTHIPAMLLAGMSRMPFITFMLLELLGAGLWSLTFTMLGYRFGKEIIALVQTIQHHMMLLLLTLALAIVLKRSLAHR